MQLSALNGVLGSAAKKPKQFDTIFEEALWIRYANSRTIRGTTKSTRQQNTLRNQLFCQYAEIPVMAAKSYSRSRLPYRSLSDYDDLLADANLGLLKCITKYDATKGIKFNTYSYTRVNGAIIDGLRVLQDFPRIISRIRREIDPLIDRLTQEVNRVPSLEEVALRFPLATVCDVSISEVIKDPLIQSNIFNQSLAVGSDAEHCDYTDSAIDNCLYKRAKNKQTESCDSMQRIAIIEKIMECLNGDKEEKAVIYYYYFMNMTSTTVSRVMKISASNVCIKKTNALTRIRHMLINNPDFLAELKEST